MSSERGVVPSVGGFFSRLRKKRIPEILAGFVAGGWLILEFVHWILIDHYRLPENLLDIVFITLLCALACTLAWRVFGGAEQRRRKFKVELLLIPLFILAAALLNVRLIGTWGRAENAAGADSEEANIARPKVDPKRAVVATFENMTGDPSLDIVGRIAADWVTQGISKIPGLEVSPAAADRPESGGEKPARAGTDIQALSRATGAGTVVTGAYFLDGEILEFRFQITDILRSKLLQSMEGIKGTLASRMEVIDLLRRRVMGAMADLFSRGAEGIPSVSTPPLYEAYQELLLGQDSFGLDYAEADRHFSRATELDPNFPYPALWRAVGLGNRGEYAAAYEIVSRLDREKDGFPPYFRLMLEWYKADLQGRKEDGLRYAREALRLYPSGLTLRHIVGNTALEVNRPRVTIEVYSAFTKEGKEVYSRRPTGHWPVGNLASAYHMLGRHEEELETVRREMSSFPGNLQVRAYEVRALAALGRFDELAKVVEESMATASTFGTAAAVMDVASRELREHGTKDLSLMYARRVVQWYRDKAAGSGTGDRELSKLADALYSAEQWEEARSTFRDLSLKHPEDIDHLGFLGTLAARLGNRDEALSISDRLKAVAKPFLFGGPSYWRACVASLLGEREQAVLLLREAFAQGASYGVNVLSDMDLEPLRDYGPFKELIKPKS
jgi:tetratricopeptide (TPR) repeat protein